ncbi:hypothetical protein PRIPAC_77808 [Pristionchus pacificus]|uniref:Uncharacterized protein n=1 Tax=Pristionchus pacificus TaxID=54126 RepID=A0A2A6CN72_PRIPA|nr:hypothetical protein PRIPAC_77808 [Pristionchus pacificus]|eukprot:PDM79685.1 hypothetical protein PRIPAC_32264 [Pristionchus pacificus]
MWSVLIVLLAASIAVVSGRVSFGSTEVIDDVDLKGRNTASFTCDMGCRVYSTTRNDQIVIVDNMGKELTSLDKLAHMNVKNGEVFELEAKIAIYQLKNKGPANPEFVFYIVENQGMSINPEKSARTTILSGSDALHISDFNGDYRDALPSVYATGIDGVTTRSCRPIYTPRSFDSLLNTYFTVFGPIATIDFGKTGTRRTVLVSDDLCNRPNLVTVVNHRRQCRAHVDRYGYVGCDTTGTALYSRISPLITSIDSAFLVRDPDGLTVSVNGDYSITNGGDALTLTVGNDVQNWLLPSISTVYTGTSLNVGVSWTKKEGSADRFALQIDTTKKGQDAVKASSSSKNEDVGTSTKGIGSMNAVGAGLFVVLRVAAN